MVVLKGGSVGKKSKSEMLAVELGATTRFRQANKSFFIEELGKDSKVLKSRMVVEITAAEAKITKNYHFLGEAMGQNFFHCLYLASRYCKNFREKVSAYAFRNTKSKEYSMVIRFYEKK